MPTLKTYLCLNEYLGWSKQPVSHKEFSCVFSSCHMVKNVDAGFCKFTPYQTIHEAPCRPREVVALTLFPGIPSFFARSCRVSDEMYKLCSINLSPNVTGQVALGIMCNPPRPGSESYANNMREKDVLLQSLIRRARLITDAFNR